MNHNGADVQFRGVGKNFDGKNQVIDDFNLVIEPGEVVAIVGASGVGKTTILRMIAGLEFPDYGEVLINREKVMKPVSSLGYLVQDYAHSLFPWLRVDGNLRLALIDTAVPKKDWRTRIATVLGHVGLAGVQRKFPWQLSGGMQQRVCLARSLLREPNLLLLDEPFASVDALTRLDLEDLTMRIVRERGMTALLVTHDIDEAIYMADRVVVVAGQPARVQAEFQVDLAEPRRQPSSKATTSFSQLREKVHLALSRNSPTNPPLESRDHENP